MPTWCCTKTEVCSFDEAKYPTSWRLWGEGRRMESFAAIDQNDVMRLFTSESSVYFLSGGTSLLR